MMIISQRLGLFTGVANLVLIKKAPDARTIGDLLGGTRVVYATEHDELKSRREAQQC
jgi:uncharacterized RDD family membrane protein YckC